MAKNLLRELLSDMVASFDFDLYKTKEVKSEKNLQLFVDKAVATRKYMLEAFIPRLIYEQKRKMAIAVLFNKRYVHKLYEYDEAGNKLLNYDKYYQFAGIEQKLKKELKSWHVKNIKGYFVHFKPMFDVIYYDEIDFSLGIRLPAVMVRTFCNFRCTNLKELRQLN